MASEEMKLSHVFVYGTLKIGQPNHKVLTNKDNGDARFVARARTIEKFPLVIASKFNIPFLLNKPGLGHRIEGEVYAVDDKMLRYLDEFEGVNVGYYDRVNLSLESLEDTVPHLPDVTCYFLTQSRDDLLQLPFLQVYDSYGPHGLPYDERLDRSATEEATALSEVKVLSQQIQ